MTERSENRKSSIFNFQYSILRWWNRLRVYTMIGTRRKSTIWLIGVCLACHLPASSHAENHALLIGIGTYQQRTLEGPAFDVKALTSRLIRHYGFKRKNVRILVNQEADKSRILSEMQRLVKISRPGDRVFVYFSGHGTSRRDGLLSLPLPHASGALVPADFNWDSTKSIEDQVSQLIVGKRDLRPILAQLDQDRQVLVVFDTCFSGNTVRGFEEPTLAGVDRYIQLDPKSIFGEEQNIGDFADNLKPDEPYPYQNTFYISASSENETAKDIRTDLLYLYPTIDGNPHGVLTDSLLRVLDGQTPVDTNSDGRWSQIELYHAVRSEVQRRFKQTPQALPKEGENSVNLHDRTFFVRSAGSIISPGEIPIGLKSGLNLRVTDDLSDLSKSVSQIEGVKIVEQNPDLVLVKEHNDIVLALPNGHPIGRFTSFESQRVLDRVRRHLSIQPLIDLSYPKQQFNVSLELIGPYQKSIIREDEPFGFEFYTEKAVYVLLIDIDPAGAVHVLYPFDNTELQPMAPGLSKILDGKCRAFWPFGTETLKLFAFLKKPDELETLMGRQDLHPGSPLFETLEKMVGIRSRTFLDAPVENDAAQAMLQITSYAGGRSNM
jgi:hypothetical protein